MVFVGNNKYVFWKGRSQLNDKQKQISKIELMWDQFEKLPSIEIETDPPYFKK